MGGEPRFRTRSRVALVRGDFYGPAGFEDAINGVIANVEEQCPDAAFGIEFIVVGSALMAAITYVYDEEGDE